MQARRSFSRATIALALAGVAFAPADARGAGAVIRALPTATTDLDAFRWASRPVLVFAPSATDADYVEQRSMLEAAAEQLADREVVVLIDTAPAGDGALRRALDVQGFEVVLFGKDGGVKLRAARPVSAEALLATIDAMPMRRREAGD